MLAKRKRGKAKARQGYDGGEANLAYSIDPK